MAKGLIRLSYRKIIDASSVKPWDKAVFDDTYREFFMQAQSFNPQHQHRTFRELLEHAPNADRLHYLTSRVATGYLKQLNQIIPDVLNASGVESLPFTQFKFEILASHVEQQAAHRVALTFFSDPLTWIDTVGAHLLVAHGDQREALRTGQEVSTDLVPLQPALNVWSFQPEPQPVP